MYIFKHIIGGDICRDRASGSELTVRLFYNDHCTYVPRYKLAKIHYLEVRFLKGADFAHYCG